MFCGTSRSERTLTATAPRRVSSRMKPPGARPRHPRSHRDISETASGSNASSTLAAPDQGAHHVEVVLNAGAAG